jgi:hypothetical protein
MNYRQIQYFGAGCVLGGGHGQGLPCWQRTGSMMRRAWTWLDEHIASMLIAIRATKRRLIGLYLMVESLL